jgi:hypothetical protein
MPPFSPNCNVCGVKKSFLSVLVHSETFMPIRYRQCAVGYGVAALPSLPLTTECAYLRSAGKRHKVAIMPLCANFSLRSTASPNIECHLFRNFQLRSHTQGGDE